MTGDLRALATIRLRTPRLVLRLPDDDEILDLVAVAAAGVHPPEQMPFRVPWTDGIGTPTFETDFAAYRRGRRESWSPGSWALEFGVFHEGRIVGGALAGNEASARVSEKLGYEPAAGELVSPRGLPVWARRYRLAATRWVSPVLVEITGLEPCLPLFGLPSRTD